MEVIYVIGPRKVLGAPASYVKKLPKCLLYNCYSAFCSQACTYGLMKYAL